jgi:hypothetical protein
LTSTPRSSFSFCGAVAAFVSIALRMAAAPPLSPDAAVVTDESDDLLELPHAETVNATATSTTSATAERRVKFPPPLQDRAIRAW